MNLIGGVSVGNAEVLGLINNGIENLQFNSK